MDEVSEGEFLLAADGGPLAEDDTDSRRVVDAEWLRQSCLTAVNGGDRRGVTLRRFGIMGSLDLSGFEIPVPLRFEDCDFDSPLLVEGAVLHELVLIRCAVLQGLVANGVRVRRDLNLSGSYLSGATATTASTSRSAALWLCESHIGGRLLCVDTFIDARGERSIQADRMQVSGNVRLLHQFTALGEVRMIGARIDGSLDLTGARIVAASTGLALDLGEAVIQGSVFLIPDKSGRRPTVHGRIDMGGAHIAGQLLIRGATLHAQQDLPVGSAYSRYRMSGTALSAPRLSVGAEATLEGACEIVGGIDLSMSDLTSLAICEGSSLHAPGRTALDLANAELRSTLTIGDQVPVQGTVRLAGARVHGNLCLRGAILGAPEGRNLVAAQGANIDGEAELQHLKADGGALGFRAATIGSVVDAAGARLVNQGGYTLSLHQANIRGSVRLVDGPHSEAKTKVSGVLSSIFVLSLAALARST